VFDAGFIRTGILEAMIKKGDISKDELVIVDKAADNFPEVHTTALYPEWYLMSQSDVAADKVAKVKAAVLKLTPEHDVSKTAGIKGFVAPVDIAPFTAVLKDMKLAPFDQ
jgi:hypothetical protein